MGDMKEFSLLMNISRRVSHGNVILPTKTSTVSRPEIVGSMFVPISLVTPFIKPCFIMEEHHEVLLSHLQMHLKSPDAAAVSPQALLNSSQVTSHLSVHLVIAWNTISHPELHTPESSSSSTLKRRMNSRSIPLSWVLLVLIAASGPASAKSVTLNLPPPPTPNTPRPLPLKIQKFISVSESHYDHAHHKHHQEESPEPHFAPVNATRRVFLGATADLHCTVHDLGNESVSWMRWDGDQLRLLTWDVNTYADDDRYALVHETGDRWQRWQLVIRDTQVKDGGKYRCQVATVPPLVLDIVLQVTGECLWYRNTQMHGGAAISLTFQEDATPNTQYHLRLISD
ncbi:uncharacterized protein [Penaeus vannamei]|uniref:uncharacterized protein n=1 Tax=Penaeus vannamei TaxID=6689 RepID=UPI00387FAC6D